MPIVNAALTAWQFASDHAFIGVALVLAGAGTWARLALPVFARQAATVLWIGAAALGAYGQGWANRAEQDRTAIVQEQVAQLQKQAADTAAVIAATQARAEAAEAAQEKDHDENEKLRADLSKAGNDCVPTDDQLSRLRRIGSDVLKP